MSTFIVLFALRKTLGSTCRRKKLFLLTPREIPMLLLLCILCVDSVYGFAILCLQLFINLSYVCVLEGIVSGFCSVSSALLTAALARQSFIVANVEVVVAQTENVAVVSRAREMSFSGILVFFGLAVGIPLCCVLGITYFGGGFGNDYLSYPVPITCHMITPTFQSEFFGCFGWIWLGVFICIYYNVRVTLLLYRELKEGNRSEDAPRIRKIKRKLKLILAYPFIYALCCVPLSTYRIIRFSALSDGVDVDSRVKPTEVFYGFGQATFILLGCFDALVLGCSNAKVRNQWCKRNADVAGRELFLPSQVALTPSDTSRTSEELYEDAISSQQIDVI